MDESKENIKNIFDDINEWLRFAEAKNGILLGINLAIVAICFEKNDFENLNNLDLFFISYIAMLLFSFCILVYSFFPNLKTNVQGNNITFYGDIYKNYQNKTEDFIRAAKVEQCYINGIAERCIINSEITLSKLKYFRWASFFTILSMVVRLTIYFKLSTCISLAVILTLALIGVFVILKLKI